MKGKIVLITGSSSGIGKQTAIELAALGATVLLHARNTEEGLPVLMQLQKDLPAAAFDLFVANFEKQHEVQKMASEIEASYDRLDVLINNAACCEDEKEFTDDTIEKTFAVNHLAPFLLTHLLLRLLKNAVNARIINVTSEAHFQAKFDIRNIQGQQTYDGVKMYCNSKLFNLLFSYQLADRLRRHPITVNAVHPGLAATTLYEKLFIDFEDELPEEAADTIVYMASSREVAQVTGEYFMSRIPIRSSLLSYHRTHQRELWALSEHLTGIKSSHYIVNEKIASYGEKRLNRLIRYFFKVVTKSLKLKTAFEYNLH